MIVLCAWCEQAGTRTVISESAVETDARRSASHGICARHQRQLLLEIQTLNRDHRHAGARDSRMRKPAHRSIAA